MRTLNSKLVLPIATAGVILAGSAMIAPSAHAADGNWSMSGLVSRLVEKFGLNQTEVDSVVEEYRGQRQAERQAQMKTDRDEHLAQAVSDGVISEAQKQALLEKLESNWQNHQAERQAHHDEMQAWAESQGFSMDDLQPYMMMGPHRGHGMMGGYQAGQ